VLMACVGAAHALMALLSGPIFERVLNPASADTPVLLFKVPLIGYKFYLNSLMPASIHNVGTMVAISIVAVFAVKGLCDYFANYLINYVGFSAVTDLRQTVFDRVLQQDAQFFEANSTARVMSSIMNDLEKIQVALSHVLADWLRQSFTALALAAVVLQTDWKLAMASLTVLPFVAVPTTRIGRRIRRTSRRTQDRQAELNQILQETLSGHMVDLVLDIRKGSPTLGKHYATELDDSSPRLIWAPASFARGFCVLSASADIEYFTTGTYSAKSDTGIRWNDPAIGIEWPEKRPILSDKDRAAQTLAEWLARPESDQFRYEP
jgi:dTDP-4-dehydrorhamnose 3,5-epimerase